MCSRRARALWAAGAASPPAGGGAAGRLPHVCRCWGGRRCSGRTEDGFAPAAARGARRGARRGAGGRSPDTGEKGLGTDAGLGSLLFWRQGPRRALLLTAGSSTCPFSPCFPCLDPRIPVLPFHIPFLPLLIFILELYLPTYPEHCMFINVGTCSPSLHPSPGPRTLCPSRPLQDFLRVCSLCSYGPSEEVLSPPEGECSLDSLFLMS